MKAPSGKNSTIPISHEAAQRLAYYQAGGDIGVLAPRGWHCFGAYGSAGDTLFVTPEPIDTAAIFSARWKAIPGPAIVLSYRFAGTSGRFEVAEIIARVFPGYKAWAAAVMGEFNNKYTSGPFPRDTLTYKSQTVVEYQTPAETDGLGTHSRLLKDDAPVDGVAILIGEPPDLFLLSGRLPRELVELTPIIIGQVEREAARLPRR